MGDLGRKSRKKNTLTRLIEKISTFDIVIPCLKDVYVCEITPANVRHMNVSSVSDVVKDWFVKNIGEQFDEEDFFEYIESDCNIVLSDEERTDIMKYVTKTNEKISLRRISMLQMLQTKHYPSELSDFVQSVYTRTEGSEAKPSDNESALAFHQWVVCAAAVDPKIMSLTRVVKMLNGEQVDNHWFTEQDRLKIKGLRDKYKGRFATEKATEYDIRLLPEFAEELWSANDPSDPAKTVRVWWVEDIVSDADLVAISGAAFNGPGATPEVSQFSEQS